MRNVGHLFGDQALAREVHLAHVGVAGTRGLFLALHDPLGTRGWDLVVVALMPVGLSRMPVTIGRMAIPVCAHAEPRMS